MTPENEFALAVFCLSVLLLVVLLFIPTEEDEVDPND